MKTPCVGCCSHRPCWWPTSLPRRERHGFGSAMITAFVIGIFSTLLRYAAGAADAAGDAADAGPVPVRHQRADVLGAANVSGFSVAGFTAAALIGSLIYHSVWWHRHRRGDGAAVRAARLSRLSAASPRAPRNAPSAARARVHRATQFRAGPARRSSAACCRPRRLLSITQVPGSPSKTICCACGGMSGRARSGCRRAGSRCRGAARRELALFAQRDLSRAPAKQLRAALRGWPRTIALRSGPAGRAGAREGCPCSAATSSRQIGAAPLTPGTRAASPRRWRPPHADAVALGEADHQLSRRVLLVPVFTAAKPRVASALVEAEVHARGVVGQDVGDEVHRGRLGHALRRFASRRAVPAAEQAAVSPACGRRSSMRAGDVGAASTSAGPW